MLHDQPSGDKGAFRRHFEVKAWAGKTEVVLERDLFSYSDHVANELRCLLACFPLRGVTIEAARRAWPTLSDETELVLEELLKWNSDGLKVQILGHMDSWDLEYIF